MAEVWQVKVGELWRAEGFDSLLDEYAAECKAQELPERIHSAEQYEALELAGMLYTFATFCGKRVTGFATVTATYIPHYGKTVASLESIFVSASERCTGAGWLLMNAVESFAAERTEAGVLLASAPVGGVFSKVLSGRKFRELSTVYIKDVKHE